ncbi:hypothetical protein VTK73DRAFT_7010 [Phialemonium thermophilum]|uniref:NADP-dependent oxidoreductase domain-containing protein n=1 Tax=Phialemonium thermophilum TaxID=223376 RepID=A0ABR3WGU8_9PEZI
MPEIHGKEVGPIGFGLMGFTWRPSPCPQEQAFEAMRAALANGCNFWNGGEFYGTPEYNSMVLLERYFEKYPEDADKVVLSIKGGCNLTTYAPEGTTAGIRRSLDNILSQLKGRKKVDLFEPARRDKSVDMRETFAAINEYIERGQVGGIGLSEVSAATIHEAVKITKIAAVEVELSLWSTDVLTNGVAAACAQYNIPLIAYSPMGRGMLAGRFKSPDDIPDGDFRKYYPRFQPDVFHINLELVKQVEKLAKQKGCTPSQLALGWVRALSKRPGMPTIIPIPGATTVERVNENSKPIDLSLEELDEIDATLAKFEVKGNRYPDGYLMET